MEKSQKKPPEIQYGKITEEAPRNIETKNHRRSPQKYRNKELETHIVRSIETLERQKMNCGIDEVHKLVQDSTEENISRESFDKT